MDPHWQSKEHGIEWTGYRMDRNGVLLLVLLLLVAGIIWWLGSKDGGESTPESTSLTVGLTETKLKLGGNREFV